MITCNGSGNPDAVVLGTDRRLRALSLVTEEEGALIRAYTDKHPSAMKAGNVSVLRALQGDTIKTYFLAGTEDDSQERGTFREFDRAKKIMAAAMKEDVGELAVYIDTLDMDVETLIDGLLYGNYEYNQYKTKSKSKVLENINLITSSLKSKDFNTLCYVYSSIYEGIYFARDLVNMPPNDMTPRKFVDTATAVCTGDNIFVEVLNKWNLEKRNMGGIVSVGKGSMNPPQLLSVAYTGDPESRDVLAVVGKGITYDSGGLSLKTRAGQLNMKSDMAGAATALGIIRALMLLKYPVNVLAVMPLAENIPSGMSYHVDDVITMFDGTTVEVKNTDAEGRLVLADAVSYAQSKGAKRIIDLATLTGACVTALGTVRSGMIGNDQDFMNRFFAAAAQVNEKVWQLPADEEYERQLKSRVADISNVGGPEAGAITAGLFIKHFIQENTSWIHLDIAGTAFRDKKDENGFYGATGVGIKSVLRLLRGDK